MTLLVELILCNTLSMFSFNRLLCLFVYWLLVPQMVLERLVLNWMFCLSPGSTDCAQKAYAE